MLQEVIKMDYEEILDELQEAISGLEMTTQFLILFSYKEEVLIKKCSEQTIEYCKDRLLNSAEQYTNDYLATAKLLLNNKQL